MKFGDYVDMLKEHGYVEEDLVSLEKGRQSYFETVDAFVERAREAGKLSEEEINSLESGMRQCAGLEINENERLAYGDNIGAFLRIGKEGCAEIVHLFGYQDDKFEGEQERIFVEYQRVCLGSSGEHLNGTFTKYGAPQNGDAIELKERFFTVQASL